MTGNPLAIKAATPQVRLLVGFATANDAESWGVERMLRWARRKRSSNPRPRSLADLEEVYHTRLLRLIVCSFGFSYTPPEPGLLLRAPLAVLPVLPTRVSRVMLAAGEIIGSISFVRMLSAASEAFEKDVRLDFIQRTIREILIDEVGHVSYLLAEMGPRSRTIVRRLLPIVLFALFQTVIDDAEEKQYYRDAAKKFSYATFSADIMDEAFYPSAFTQFRHAGVSAL